MRKTAATLLLLLLCQLANSQSYLLSGLTSDQEEPLPFVTILVKGSTYSTISNVNGRYSFRLPPGSYEIIYQHIGYASESRRVELTGPASLDVTLVPDGISLKEVEIKAGEDPSYPIIRQAIRKKKFYLGQPEAYSCQAYIKGLQKMHAIPKNLKSLIRLAGGELSDTNSLKGILYLSESVSKYHYQAPDQEKEIMYASKVSGNNKAFSFNKLSDMKLNLYQNLIPFGNLSSRPFISPLHDNAFAFYRYYLLGSLREDGYTVHKIKVVPRQKTAPCFSGIISIQDSTWRITGLDLMITREAKINFMDTLSIQQLYAPTGTGDVWMPVSLNLSFDLKAFGFRGSGYVMASMSDYDLQPVFPDGFFRNEVLRVETDANHKDSSYWDQVRSAPLTQEELDDYREKDSLSNIRDTDQYKDSVDRQRNRLRFRDLLLGYEYNRSRTQLRIALPGLISSGIQYNTVEGLNLSYTFEASRTYEDLRRFELLGGLRYGFANRLWGGELGFNYMYRPRSLSSYGFRVKSMVTQYNREEPIPALINSLYTLYLNENHMKLFKETGAEANYFTELYNGLFFSGKMSYMQRDPLVNNSLFLLIDDRNKLFSSNDPQHPGTHDSLFPSHRAFTTELSFTFRFRQKYYTLPDRKVRAGSKYPRVTLSYRKAIPLAGARVNYDLLSAVISDHIPLGQAGRLSYRVKGGGFLNTRQLYFPDFVHFRGNQTIFQSGDYLGSFRLLPYYRYSADLWYAEFHAEHQFRGFLIGFIPLIKRLRVQEVAGVHVLSNNRLPYYYELNFGLERIFRVIRADYVAAFSPDQSIRHGFTVGLKLSF
jgi:hypothetical protein